jgi:hypothetical protein
MQPVEARGYTPEEIKMTPPVSFSKVILETGVRM